MDTMSSGDKSDDELTMLEDICNSIQFKEMHATRYVIALNEVKRNIKECYYQRETWVKVYTRYLRLLLMIFHKHY